MQTGFKSSAEKQGVFIQVAEFGDRERLSQINPLSLPRLYAGSELAASQNPPAAHIIETALA